MTFRKQSYYDGAIPYWRMPLQRMENKKLKNNRELPRFAFLVQRRHGKVASQDTDGICSEG